jgi:trimeric autotransporter adhesin
MWPRYSDNVMYTNYGSGGWNIRNSSGSSKVFIDSNGYMGLGTTTPYNRLEVLGAAAIGTGSPGTVIGLRGVYGYITTDAVGSFSLKHEGGSTSELKMAGNGIFMSTAGAQRAYLDPYGNFGIGTSAALGSKLDVLGVATLGTGTPGSIINMRNGFDGNATGSLLTDASSNFSLKNIGGATTEIKLGGSHISLNTFGTTRMTLDPYGSVGIGTTTPGQKLTVTGTIESTSGGIKFPDGTIQTTASSGSGGGAGCAGGKLHMEIWTTGGSGGCGGTLTIYQCKNGTSNAVVSISEAACPVSGAGN